MKVQDIKEENEAKSLLELNWDVVPVIALQGLLLRFPKIDRGDLLRLYAQQSSEFEPNRERIKIILLCTEEGLIPCHVVAMGQNIMSLGAQLYPLQAASIAGLHGNEYATTIILARALAESKVAAETVDQGVLLLAANCPGAVPSIALEYPRLAMKLAGLYPEDAGKIASTRPDDALKIAALSASHALAVAKEYPELRKEIQQMYIIEE